MPIACFHQCLSPLYLLLAWWHPTHLMTSHEHSTIYHVTYAFQSEPTLYSFLNVKELLARKKIACFEQGVSRHSGNYRVWIHSETHTLHDKNIQIVLVFAILTIGPLISESQQGNTCVIMTILQKCFSIKNYRNIININF